LNKKGFTLIELVITISILMIVLGIAAPNFMGTLRKEQREADETLIYQLNDSTESYALVSGSTLNYADVNFVFNDCKVNGNVDYDLATAKLMENGFMISVPDANSKDASFAWDQARNEWYLKFGE